MIHYGHDHRAAPAALTYIAEPADTLLGALVQAVAPGEALAAIQSGTLPAVVSQRLDAARKAGARRSVPRSPAAPFGADLLRQFNFIRATIKNACRCWHGQKIALTHLTTLPK
jgi:hypothetical protein